MQRQATIRKNEVPAGWSMEAADFINKCLARKASHRLGNKGNVEVKQHAWFATFDWQGLIN